MQVILGQTTLEKANDHIEKIKDLCGKVAQGKIDRAKIKDERDKLMGEQRGTKRSRSSREEPSVTRKLAASKGVKRPKKKGRDASKEESNEDEEEEGEPAEEEESEEEEDDDDEWVDSDGVEDDIEEPYWFGAPFNEEKDRGSRYRECRICTASYIVGNCWVWKDSATRAWR